MGGAMPLHRPFLLERCCKPLAARSGASHAPIYEEIAVSRIASEQSPRVSGGFGIHSYNSLRDLFSHPWS